MGSPFIGFRSWLFNFHFLNRRSFENFSNYYREVIRSWSIMNCEFVRTQTRDGFANLARLICGVNSPVMTYKNIHIHVTAYIGIPSNYKGVRLQSFHHIDSKFIVNSRKRWWIQSEIVKWKISRIRHSDDFYNTWLKIVRYDGMFENIERVRLSMDSKMLL